MAQRNPMNDRYNDETRKGSTRKSAASAKPATARAATVRPPAEKSKREKKKELQMKNKHDMEKRGVYTGKGLFEKSAEYKKLRRTWAVCLGVAIFMVVVSFWALQYSLASWIYIGSMILGYMLIILAFYIDFVKIRRARRAFYEAHDNSKENRAAQKKARAEAREKEKAAAEADEKPAAEKKGGFFSNLFNK